MCLCVICVSVICVSVMSHTVCVGAMGGGGGGGGGGGCGGQANEDQKTRTPQNDVGKKSSTFVLQLSFCKTFFFKMTIFFRIE